MKKCVARWVSCWLCLTSFAVTSLSLPYEDGTVVPLPKIISKSESLTYTVDCLGLKVVSPSDDAVLSRALTRFFAVTFTQRNIPPHPQMPILRMLILDVDPGPIARLRLGVNESYSIFFENNSVRVHSATRWGALYGLETLSQMIHQSRPSGSYIVHALNVEDSPSLQYRGMEVDAATSYISISALEKFINAISYLKFNTLVLQLSNDDNFAFPTRQYTELQLNKNPNGHTYSWNELEHLRQYAHDRGVILGVGFLLPEHSSVWSAIPNITIDCIPDEHGRVYKMLNVTSEKAISVVAKVLDEAAELFRSSLLVLGGDPGWNSCRSSSFLSNLFYSPQIQTDMFLLRVLNATRGGWQRVALSSNVQPYTMSTLENLSFITRRDDTEASSDIHSVINNGGKSVIYSNCFNLTRKRPWKAFDKIPLCHDIKSKIPAEEWTRVLGGGAFIQSPTELDLFSKVFAKAFSVADVLWNADRYLEFPYANLRYHENNCRFSRRGIVTRDLIASRPCHHEFA